jgi:hypothetical protein
MAADPDPCTGIKILDLAVAASSLVVVLAEPLGCPVCGYTSTRWEIPNPDSGGQRMRHDPGE